MSKKSNYLLTIFQRGNIQYFLKSKIDYEENVLESIFEEFDIDEVQHVEGKFYRQSSMCFGKCK